MSILDQSCRAFGDLLSDDIMYENLTEGNGGREMGVVAVSSEYAESAKAFRLSEIIKKLGWLAEEGSTQVNGRRLF